MTTLFPTKSLPPVVVDRLLAPSPTTPTTPVTRSWPTSEPLAEGVELVDVRFDDRTYVLRRLSDGAEVVVSFDDDTPVSEWFGSPMVSLAVQRRAARARFYTRGGKRVLDVTTASIGLILTLPLMAIVALTVRLSMGPGVFYRQERVGHNGRRFTVLKFRTMHPDRRTVLQDPPEGVDRRLTHKSDADPRHTLAGRILRRWGVDELPQLWNVLRGDMSVVGPRPELPSVVARYQNWQHERHAVKPGITGLWQISERGKLAMHHCVNTDIEYVRNVSFRDDVGILVRTIPAALRRTGS